MGAMHGTVAYVRYYKGAMAVLLPEDKLNEMYSMVKENHRMLKDMRRDAFIGGLLQIVWWVVVLIVLPYVSWLFIQPYLQGLMGTYQAAQNQSAQLSGALSELNELGGGKFDVSKLLEQFGSGKTQ